MPTQEVERLHYESVLIPLNKARNNELTLDLLDCDVLVVARVVSTTPVFMRINYPDAPPIEALQGFSLKLRTGRIRRIYLTHAAEPNGFMWLLMGGPEEMEFVYPQTVVVAGFETLLRETQDIRNRVYGELQVAATGNDLSLALAAITTPIAAGAEYVSPWFVLDRFGTLCVTVVADVPGTLYVEMTQGYTKNGEYLVDASETHVYPGGNQPYGLEIPVVAPFGRLRYVNGDSDQSTFRLVCRGRVI